MVPDLTRFEPLRVMAIFGTYLRAGRGSKPVWFRGPKTSLKVPIIYGANSGGPNPKLMMTLKKACPPPPLKRALKMITFSFMASFSARLEVHTFLKLSITDLPFRFCKIRLKNTLFILSFVCFVCLFRKFVRFWLTFLIVALRFAS